MASTGRSLHGVPKESAWVDISRPLTSATPVWPGDQPFRLDRHEHGGTVVSSLTTTCHVGTHVDAPMHLDSLAGGVESIELDRLIGPAEVVSVSDSIVTPESLPSGWSPAVPRLLLRTGSHPVGAPIGPGFAAVAARLVHWLADRGVVLLAIDTPSVDPFDSVDLAAHRALVDRGMTWIEGVRLEHVAPGRYQLVALPLALVGADAAPVRAALRPEPGPGRVTPP
jgi:arylformamidase